MIIFAQFFDRFTTFLTTNDFMLNLVEYFLSKTVQCVKLPNWNETDTFDLKCNALNTNFILMSLVQIIQSCILCQWQCFQFCAPIHLAVALVLFYFHRRSTIIAVDIFSLFFDLGSVFFWFDHHRCGFQSISSAFIVWFGWYLLSRPKLDGKHHIRKMAAG